MRDIDLNLTEEQSFLRDTVRRFGAEVVRPAGLKLDKMADPEDTIATGSVLWDVIKQSRELGLHLGDLPRSVGGTMEDMDAMSTIILEEELGYADAGQAISPSVKAVLKGDEYIVNGQKAA